MKDKSKKRGRPPGSKKENTKKNIITLRITDNENDDLNKKSRLSGLTRSQYLRMLIRNF